MAKPLSGRRRFAVIVVVVVLVGELGCFVIIRSPLASMELVHGTRHGENIPKVSHAFHCRCSQFACLWYAGLCYFAHVAMIMIMIVSAFGEIQQLQQREEQNVS